MSNKDNEKLFDYVMVISLQGQQGNYVPVISYRFPPAPDKKDKISNAALQFCFPEANSSDVKSLLSATGSETFSFVLTDVDGSKRFGYCRRFLGKNPECYCIVSFFPSFSLFAQILDIVEQRRETSSSATYLFLKSVLAADKVPQPGESIQIKTLSPTKNDPDEYTLTRDDTDYEYLDYVSFTVLFKKLSVDIILTLFEALLSERRIIVVSKSLAVLSSCVHAISAMVWPFTWQHVFIPILPPSLIDYTCAPMPFLVGILHSSLDALYSLPLEEVYIVDLEKNHFRELPNFPSIMPSARLEQLRRALTALVAGPVSVTFDKMIADCFVLFLADILEGYEKYISKGGFQLKEFIASKDKETQKFLQDFCRTQMFDCFIHDQEKSASQQQQVKVARLSEYKIQILSQPVNPTNFASVAVPTEQTTAYVCEKCGLKLRDVEVFHRKGKIYCNKCVTSSGRKNLFGGLLEKLGNKIETKMGHHPKSSSVDISESTRKERDKKEDKDDREKDKEKEKDKEDKENLLSKVKNVGGALFKGRRLSDKKEEIVIGAPQNLRHVHHLDAKGTEAALLRLQHEQRQALQCSSNNLKLVSDPTLKKSSNAALPAKNTSMSGEFSYRSNAATTDDVSSRSNSSSGRGDPKPKPLPRPPPHDDSVVIRSAARPFSPHQPKRVPIAWKTIKKRPLPRLPPSPPPIPPTSRNDLKDKAPVELKPRSNTAGEVQIPRRPQV